LATAAAYAEISPRKLRGLLAGPDPLPAARIGRLIRIHRPALDAWMLRRTAANAVDLVLEELRSSRPRSSRPHS
jgi:hypothetical protein